MHKRILLALFLLSQSACFVILPFVEQDQSAVEQPPLSCKIAQEQKIAKINPVDKALKNLTSINDAVRTTAATELGFIGQARPDVLIALKTATWKDRSKWVRRAAVKSVYKLAGRDAIPTLKNALKDKDPWVVHSAQRALAMLK